MLKKVLSVIKMKKNIMISIILILSISVSSITYASNWKEIKAKGEIDKIYIDLDSIKREDEKAFFWIKDIYAPLNYFRHKNKLVVSEMNYYFFDCKMRVGGLLSRIYYDNNNNLIDKEHFEGDYGNFRRFIPDTAEEQYYKLACNTGKNSEESNVDFSAYTSRLQTKIKSNWNQPNNNFSQKVIINFKINKNGLLISHYIKQSSGDKSTDNAAIQAIIYSAPFEPLPIEYQEEFIEIDFSFNYDVFNSSGKKIEANSHKQAKQFIN